MKLEKFNKILKIFIIVLAIILVVAIPISLISFNKVNNQKPLKKHECTKAGNFCSQKAIYDGVEVEVALSNTKKERFYVIDNDERTMTLIMNKNIVKEYDWHSELFNINGPDEPMKKLVEKTKNWKNIDVIKDFVYLDSGLKTYIENCANNTTEQGYDCGTKLNPTRGYFGLEIKNGKLAIQSNLINDNSKYNITSNVKARLITAEELDNLVYKKKLPDWLISNLGDNEGYWTLTSSTSKKTNYSQGAIALAKVDKQPSIESLFVQKVYESKYEIGIRPVITIEKEAVKQIH